MSYGVSLRAWVGCHTTFKDIMFDGSDVAIVRIKTIVGVALAEITLDDVASSVDPLTGTLTFVVADQEDSALASGDAAIAEIFGTDGAMIMTLPCREGTEPLSGYCIVDELTITQGTPVEIESIVIRTGAVIP